MDIKRKINTLLLLSLILAFRLTLIMPVEGRSVVVRRANGKADCAETETEIDETETEAQPMEYTEEDLYVLSHIIQCEAGYCEREMMEGVGSVVLNRVADPRFPNTITEVVNQPGQYRPVTDGIFTSAEPTELVIEVSIDLLEWGSKFPPEVIYQANYPLGASIYKTLSTSYSTMYFCYG